MRHSWSVQEECGIRAWVCCSFRGTSDIDGSAIRQQWLSCRAPHGVGHGGLPCQHLPTGSEMGSQVFTAIHRPLSENAEVRVLRVARRAIRQFYRILHKGQVISSEAQLAVTFCQKVIDKVRTSLPSDAQELHGHQETAAAQALRHRRY